MLPLEGITVVSLEQAVAAPFATRQLADLGARVIKVERPEVGDFARGHDRTVKGLASHFVWLNRTKESLTLAVLAEVATPYLLEQGTPQRTASAKTENPPASARTLRAEGTLAVQQPGHRQAAGREELIQVSEDSRAVRGEEPPDNGADKTVARIQFEVLAENPYKFTEHEFYYEVHVVRRKRTDLKLESYNIKRIPLLKRYGWGIHRDAEGKLALVACESDRYEELLADPSVKKTQAYRSNAP
jgi:hypothetical protein